MNPWREVLKALEAELDRLSQEIEGRSVLPNAVTAVLPAARFERWAPILEAVTSELGEALVEWVGASRRRWFADAGPFLTVRLDAESTEPEIDCRFLEAPPGARPATEEEPGLRDSAAEPLTESAPVAAEAGYEAVFREDADAGGALASESALSRFELDSRRYLSDAVEPPAHPPELARRRRSRQETESGAEDEDYHLSEIELE